MQKRSDGNVVSVGSPSVTIPRYLGISTFILEKKPLYVRNMGKSSPRAHFLQSIKDLMSETKPLIVVNVSKLSTIAPHLSPENPHRRVSPINAVDVGRPSKRAYT